MLFLFILVCVYSGFGWLFSRVGYNRAFPLIGGNQEWLGADLGRGQV